MKKRIIYVGTLLDLAMLFEPGEEDEQEEIQIHISKKIRYGKC